MCPHGCPTTLPCSYCASGTYYPPFPPIPTIFYPPSPAYCPPPQPQPLPVPVGTPTSLRLENIGNRWESVVHYHFPVSPPAPSPMYHPPPPPPTTPIYLYPTIYPYNQLLQLSPYTSPWFYPAPPTAEFGNGVFPTRTGSEQGYENIYLLPQDWNPNLGNRGGAASTSDPASDPAAEATASPDAAGDNPPPEGEGEGEGDQEPLMSGGLQDGNEEGANTATHPPRDSEFGDKTSGNDERGGTKEATRGDPRSTAAEESSANEKAQCKDNPAVNGKAKEKKKPKAQASESAESVANDSPRKADENEWDIRTCLDGSKFEHISGEVEEYNDQT